MNIYKIYLIIFLIELIYGCNNEKVRIKNELSKLENRLIIIPNLTTFNANDSISKKTPYTILNYIDSLGCTECKLLLPSWKTLIKEIDSIAPNKVKFLFFINTSNIKKTKRIFQYNEFNYPIFFDPQDSLNILNHFPKDERFHTFLLDRNNRVKAIGNPITNPKIKELYLKVITGDTLPKKQAAQTTVEYGTTVCNLGEFTTKESPKAMFSLKNTGTFPLVVADVVTSCGCATPRYDKKPVNPGETMKIMVEMKIKEEGYFEKTISVYCNTQNSPLQFKVKGCVNNKKQLILR